MKKILLSGMTVLALYSCKKTEVSPETSSFIDPVRSSVATGRNAGDSCEATTTTVSLLAGQTMNAGNVTVTNDGVLLTVTYTCTGGWLMNEIHLYVGPEANAPQNNNGNPIPGHFPYKRTFSEGVSTYTQTIFLSNLPDCFIVAAHAVVKNGSNTQTGWGNGTQFSGNNWGMFFNYCKTTCP